MFHVDAVPALDDVGDGDRTPSGDLVRVEGRLRPLHHSDFERTLGELDRSRYMAFEGRPAMIADVVNPGYR